MSANSILYPAIAMFFLTLSLLLYMAYARVTAILRKDVSIGYFRAYNSGELPPNLHILGRHLSNHFETPPLFYVAVVLLFVTGLVSTLTVALAWAYVVLRVCHSIVHLGHNNVNHRFVCFVLSMFCTAGLWVSLLLGLLN